MAEDTDTTPNVFAGIGKNQGFDGGADKFAGDNQSKKKSIFDKKHNQAQTEPPREVFQDEDTLEPTKIADEIHALFKYPQVTVLYEFTESPRLYIDEDHERMATPEETREFFDTIPRRLHCVSTGYEVGKMVSEEIVLDISPEELVNEVILVVDEKLPANSIRGYNSSPNEPITLVFPKPMDNHKLGEKVSYTSLTYVSAHETCQKLVSKNFKYVRDKIGGQYGGLPLNLLEEGVVEKTVIKNFDKIDPKGLLRPDSYPYQKAVDFVNILCDELVTRGATMTTHEAFKLVQRGIFEIGGAQTMIVKFEKAFGPNFIPKFARFTTMKGGALDSDLADSEKSKQYDELIALLRRG